jgi:hypothetical protein
LTNLEERAPPTGSLLAAKNRFRRLGEVGLKAGPYPVRCLWAEGSEIRSSRCTSENRLACGTFHVVTWQCREVGARMDVPCTQSFGPHLVRQSPKNGANRRKMVRSVVPPIRDNLRTKQPQYCSKQRTVCHCFCTLDALTRKRSEVQILVRPPIVGTFLA